MSVETASLWPTDFGEQSVLTPLAILRQQGAALGDQTKNLVVGRVSTGGNRNGEFLQSFSVFCAPLGYQILLFTVKHGIDLYPASVQSAIEEPVEQTAANPEELMAILRGIFARPKTKQIVASLLAQSRQ